MPDAAELIAKVLPDTPVDDAILDAIALSACADGVTHDELVTILRIARELPSLRVGKSYRLREQDIHSYLNERYTEAG